jgi:isocitrate lyase
MAANKMANPPADLNKEDAAFAAEVAAVKQWWSDSRWRYTKRPFTAEQIVVKRGTLPIEYPSNHQSKKLWKTLEQRFQVSLACTTLVGGLRADM